MSTACAVNGQETFLQANQAYQEKKYEKALTLYSKINQKGAAVWYNMGNCHYHLDHQSDALVCWKRAQKGASKKIMQDAASNIDAVLADTKSAQSPFWALSLLLLQFLFLITWFLFALGLRLSKRGKKYKVATFILGILLIPQSVYIGHSYVHRDELQAIVHQDTNLYAGPNEKYHIIGHLEAKGQLRVCMKDDNWYKVAHGKQIGWVHSSAVIIV